MPGSGRGFRTTRRRFDSNRILLESGFGRRNRWHRCLSSRWLASWNLVYWEPDYSTEWPSFSDVSVTKCHHWKEGNPWCNQLLFCTNLNSIPGWRQRDEADRSDRSPVQESSLYHVVLCVRTGQRKKSDRRVVCECMLCGSGLQSLI